MTMNKNLMLAVLSMDAYDPQGTIGIATQLKFQPSLSSGFSAVAYNYDGKTVISYRGSDDPIAWTGSDAWYGWGGAFGAETTQAGQAAEFYKSVVGNAIFPYSTLGSVVFTGHSLGGGLAGLMAGLYGQEAVVFDNMAYAAAINKTYHDATTPSILVANGEEVHVEVNPNYQPILNTFYNGQTPQPTNTSHISGYQLDGQIIQNTQSTGTIVGADVNWGLGSLNLHSIALLVLNMYAKKKGRFPLKLPTCVSGSYLLFGFQV